MTMTLKDALELAITILYFESEGEAEDVLYAHYRELFPESDWSPQYKHITLHDKSQ